MPPKVMSKGAIMDLVKDLLAKDNQADPKSKKRIIEWGDESEEEDESLTRETSNRSKDPKVDQDKKVFLDSFRSLRKESMEHIPSYSGILNGEEFLEWLEAREN